jgi:glycosyltransferase involved in cell wall biosynthesis
MIHIGVNALYLIPGGVGGTEIYLRSLLEALAALDGENRYTVFTNRETASDLIPAQANFQHAPQTVSGVNRPARIVWEQTVLPWAAARLGIQVMFNPGFTAPLLASCPNVTVFHDLQHKRHPEHFRWFDLPFWRMLLYASVHRSRSLIAVSTATAEDLVHFYSLVPGRITVVPHGVDEEFFRIARERTPERMLLCVSTLHPHKNLDTLLRAFALFRLKYPGYSLVIAGLRGFYADSLEHLRAELGLAESVRFTGWIPREELYRLFQRASAFLYPSRFEGFGMPVLEALAAGIPTACSAIEPMRTIAGPAALQFDPETPEAIVFAMESLTGDESLRLRLTQAGPLRARQFSWATSACATLNVLKAAL